MLGSTVLEVATGMVFVFLLVALICSQIGNKISEFLNWRAKDLEDGLRDLMLGKHQTLLHEVYNSPYFQQANQTMSWFTSIILRIPLLNRGIFAHIKNGKDSVLGPISIDAKSFGLAFFDAVCPKEGGVTQLDQWKKGIEGMQDNPLKKALLPIVSAADTTIDDARARIEEWFNHAEQTMTLTYRQHMWQFSLLIGIIVSVTFNVDTIAIGNRLWYDQELRKQVNAAAAEYSAKAAEAAAKEAQTPVEPGKEKKQTPSQALEQSAKQELLKLNLPIGWQARSGKNWVFLGLQLPILPNDWLQAPLSTTALGQWRDLLTKLLGWIITAIAGAQGAPFWFDILKRLTQRNETAKAAA